MGSVGEKRGGDKQVLLGVSCEMDGLYREDWWSLGWRGGVSVGDVLFC